MYDLGIASKQGDSSLFTNPRPDWGLDTKKLFFSFGVGEFLLDQILVVEEV